MKCDCAECKGTGEIPCPECDGEGFFEGSIESVEIPPSVENYEELKALQLDARRAIKQADQLKQLNPSRSDSYAEQLTATLGIINKQANKAAQKK